MPKYIFVTGGVVSGLGKGIAAASIGALLEARGLKVNLMKFDPYINVDPGTMSPFQHGEVFVTDDGAETDLDLGTADRELRLGCARKSREVGQEGTLAMAQPAHTGIVGEVGAEVFDELGTRRKIVFET